MINVDYARDGVRVCLEANVELNRFGWVDARPVALGERRGETEFFSFGAGSALGSYAPASGLAIARPKAMITRIAMR